MLGRRVGTGFACVATSVPGPELAWVLHGCNKCAMSKVGMGFAWVATCVPALVLAWLLHVKKLGLTSVWAYVGPLERLAQHKAQHKENTRAPQEK